MPARFICLRWVGISFILSVWLWFANHKKIGRSTRVLLDFERWIKSIFDLGQ